MSKEKSDRDITNWDTRLADQVRYGWDNYKHLSINLSQARLDESFRIAGEYIYVEDSSSNLAVAKIKINRSNNDALDLLKGVKIETIFLEIFITNEALEDEWLDLIFGVNFKYKIIGGGTGATEAQQVLNLTHANPNTSVQAAANTCIEAIIKADVQNTGISWIDFGVAAVQNSCVPLDPGEWIKVPITNTNRIYANFEVGGEIVYITYAT